MARPKKQPDPEQNGDAKSLRGSLRSYSRHRLARGLFGSLPSVRKAIASGRIDGLGPDGLLDFAKADEQWELGKRRVRAEHEPIGQPAAGGEDGLADGDPRVKLVDATTRERQARAELQELKLAQQRGDLLDAAEVKKAAFQEGRRLRDRLMLIPDRIAHQLAATPDPVAVHALLDREIREALAE